VLRSSVSSTTVPFNRADRNSSRNLQLELGELGSIDVDIDLTLTGFSTGEIDVILDIDPAYVDVAIDRWSARTGLKPRLEGPTS
jgi:hypothetical protein